MVTRLEDSVVDVVVVEGLSVADEVEDVAVAASIGVDVEAIGVDAVAVQTVVALGITKVRK